MSDELIKSLERRLSEAERSAAGKEAEIKDLRRERRDLRAKIEATEKETAELTDGLKAEVTKLTAERDQWQQKATAAPSEQAAKISELEREVRTRDHRDAWNVVVGKELAEKASVDDLWAKIKHTPGESMPTSEEISELVAKARDAAPYLFAPRDGDGKSPAADKAATQGDKKQPLVVADSASRGARDTAAAVLRYRKSDTQIPGWQTKNKPLAEALARNDGSAVLID